MGELDTGRETGEKVISARACPQDILFSEAVCVSVGELGKKKKGEESEMNPGWSIEISLFLLQTAVRQVGGGGERKRSRR